MSTGPSVAFLESRGDVSGAEALQTAPVFLSTVQSRCAYALIVLQIQQNSRKGCSHFWFLHQQDND